MANFYPMSSYMYSRLCVSRVKLRYRGAHQHVCSRVECQRTVRFMNERVYRAQHLVLWNARLSKDLTENVVDKVVEAVMWQQGIPVQHTGEYRSNYSYDKLWESLTHYDREWIVDGRNVHFRAGSNQAFRIFARPKSEELLKPVNLTTSVKALYTELSIRDDSAAGLTAFGETKLEAFTVGLDKAIDILTCGKAPAPCLAGVRTQRKGKTRLVWGYPLEMTIIEAVIARPLIDHFKNADHVMTFGDYSSEIGMKMRRSASETKFHYSLDYSQFDASVNALLINRAFNAFRTWFNLSDEVYPGVTVGQVFDLVEKYFITTPIVMPKRGRSLPVLVTGKRGGVPSGSYFTQMVDSFANVAMIKAADSRFEIGIKDHNLYVLGDDCLFFCNKIISIAQISSYLSNFGFKLNAAKGSSGLATDPVEYLGRVWKNGFPIRTIQQIMRGALYPEKYRRYSSERGIRQEQALAVVNSYLLTSYVEGSPVGVDRFGHVFMVTPWLSNGMTRYLLLEGLLPGKVLKRALY
jgi:hypothetical protein